MNLPKDDPSMTEVAKLPDSSRSTENAGQGLSLSVTCKVIVGAGDMIKYCSTMLSCIAIYPVKRLCLPALYIPCLQGRLCRAVSQNPCMNSSGNKPETFSSELVHDARPFASGAVSTSRDLQTSFYFVRAMFAEQVHLPGGIACVVRSDDSMCAIDRVGGRSWEQDL